MSLKRKFEDERDDSLDKRTKTLVEASTQKTREEAEKLLNDLTLDSTMQKMTKTLKEVVNSGYYVAWGEVQQMPSLPGLIVKNFGVVPLPLTEDTTKRLIKQCQVGSVADPKDIGSFLLESSHVELLNPQWDLRHVLRRVMHALGIHKPITAKFSKVLVQKKGMNYMKRLEMRPAKGQFATLIVQLPSVYTGGELAVLKKNDASQSNHVIELGHKQNRTYSVNFAAFYCDHPHEFYEIKSGCRISLIYSLCWKESEAIGFQINKKLSDSLSSDLNDLNKQPYHFGFMLDIENESESFGPNGVKDLTGIDKDRINVLLKANEKLAPENQLSIYICKAKLSIEYRTHGYQGLFYDDSSDDDELGRDFDVSEWYDLNGKRVFNSNAQFQPSLSNVFDINAGKKIKLEDELSYSLRETERHGNEIIQSSCAGLVVVWPKRFKNETLLKLDVNYCVDSMYSSIVDKKLEINDDVCRKFKSIVDYDSKNAQFGDIRSPQVNKILELLVVFNQVNFAQTFLHKQRPKVDFENSRQLAHVLANFGFDTLRDHLDFLFDSRITSLSTNCSFIENLLELGQTSCAEHILKEGVVDPMKEPDYIQRLKKLLNYDPFVAKDHQHIFVELVKTLVRFPSSVTVAKDGLDLITHTVLDSMNRSDDDDKNEIYISSITNLIDEINKETEFFKQVPQVVDMYERRKRWLDEKMKTRPDMNSWRFPDANLPTHEIVEAFLHSDQDEMIYTNKSMDADGFVKLYDQNRSPLTLEFSIQVTKRTKHSVHIRKTTKYFERIVVKYDKWQEELAKIYAFLN